MTKKSKRVSVSTSIYSRTSMALIIIFLEKRNRQSAAYLKFIFLTIQIYGCLNSTGLCKTGRKNRDWREGMDRKEMVVVLIYFGYTVTGPYALNTKQLIHLKIIAKNYEQVRSKISMLTVGDQ
jgi:hypothetical protein